MKTDKKETNQHKPKMRLLAIIGSKFFNWIRLLIDNKFDFELKFFPYIIFITVMSIIYSPFALIEKIIHNKKIKNTKIKEPIFVIGHMRSGTTFLHYLLCQDNQFAWVSNFESVFPQVFLTLKTFIRTLLRFILPTKRPMDDMPFSADMPQEEEFAIANLCPYSPYNGVYFPKNLLEYNLKYALFEGVDRKVIKSWKKTYEYFLKKISYKSGGKRVLSKSIVNPVRIKHLIKMFPDAKFLFIYRNPYELFLSSKKLYKKNVLKNMSFHDIEDKDLEYTILELACRIFERYFEDRKLIKKENLVEIKYEDFIIDPVKFLEDAYNKLDIPDFEKSKHKFESLVSNYKNYKAEKYQIKEETRQKVYSRLKEVFQKYGYPEYEYTP